jgi:hypothetical protein
MTTELTNWRNNMYLYLLSQDDNTGYTYDSIIVVANSEEEAVLIHPYGVNCTFDEEGCWKSVDEAWHDNVWVYHPSHVHCELIGVADAKYDKPQVVWASFNAG